MNWIRFSFYLTIIVLNISCSPEKLEYSNDFNISLKEYMKVSILGDSYSTFKGYLSPNNNITYYPKPTTGVTDVTQTWWYMFIANNNLILEYNNSYSGSTISYKKSEKKSAYIDRYQDLGSPDIIFVFGGTNDNWQDIPLGNYQYSNWKEKDLFNFRPAFAYLLYELKVTYPKAQIINLINTGLKKEYKESMQIICQYYSICNISLGDFDKKEDHPSKYGMKSIYKQISEILKVE